MHLHKKIEDASGFICICMTCGVSLPGRLALVLKSEIIRILDGISKFQHYSYILALILDTKLGLGLSLGLGGLSN